MKRFPTIELIILSIIWISLLLLYYNGFFSEDDDGGKMEQVFLCILLGCVFQNFISIFLLIFRIYLMYRQHMDYFKKFIKVRVISLILVLASCFILLLMLLDLIVFDKLIQPFSVFLLCLIFLASISYISSVFFDLFYQNKIYKHTLIDELHEN